MQEPGSDLDFADDNATAWNRAALGMIDEPTEHAVTAADILAVTAAESFVMAVLPYAP